MKPIEIGATVFFLPYKAEANDCAEHAYQRKRNGIPDLLSGTVIEKGLRWRSCKLDNMGQIERIELILVKDNATGHLWSIRTERVLEPNFQPNTNS
jgi:hypothetical protein